MDRRDPNIVIGIEVLRAELESVKLHYFGNNVDAMLTDMEENYVKILDNQSTCESIRRYCLNVLLSGPNAKFNAFIEIIKDDIDSQTGSNKTMSFDEICTAARSKYNNMDACDKYSKFDPKNAKILALTTRLKNLEKSTTANSAHATTGGGNGGNNLQGAGTKTNNPTGNMTVQIATWRTINKGPTSTAPDGNNKTGEPREIYHRQLGSR